MFVRQWVNRSNPIMRPLCLMALFRLAAPETGKCMQERASACKMDPDSDNDP